VVVLDENAARRLFGQESALEKMIRVGGIPTKVVGLYAQPGNIFSPPGQEIGAVLPYLMLERHFTIDKTNQLYIPVKPKKGVSTEQAQEAVTIALREMRGLRPADKNTFDFISQDQILDTFNKITGVFFLVMIVLSSVGLLVGGIGVMAIMMVSVTSRTREIGIRKAVGATRREILFQFLVEAATLTGFGGLIGIAVGLTFGRIVTLLMNIDAGVPIGLTVTAVMVSVSIGLIFGMLPAQRAAKLDPIDALRYE
jgi:putative ABC transport system permease protein